MLKNLNRAIRRHLSPPRGHDGKFISPYRAKVIEKARQIREGFPDRKWRYPL